MTAEKTPLTEKKKFGQALTEPHPSITDFAERRFAKVLATLLLALLPLYFVPEGVRAIVERHSLVEVLYFVFGTIVLIMAYWLARGPRPRVGAALTMVYFTVLPFISLVTQAERYAGDNARNALIWSVPIMLMALILLHPRDVKWIVALQIGLYLVIPAVWDRLSYGQVFSTLWLLIAVGGLMIVSAFVQSRYLRRAVKEAEQTKRSRERFRDLFISSPVALLEADFSAIKTRLDAFAAEHDDVKQYIFDNPESMAGAGSSVRLLDANLQAQKLYEADGLFILLDSLHFAVDPHEMLALRDGVIALWDGKANVPIETVHRTLAGNKKNVVVRFSVRAGYEDSWEYVNISVNDVTERRAAEASVRQLASAVEASASSILITDKDGVIEYVNPAFENTTGYSAEEALGQNSNILKSGEHPDEFYAEMWQTIRSGKAWDGELVNKKKNGELYWEAATISPVRDETGEIRQYVAVKDDISQVKEAQEQIRQQSEFLTNVMDSIDSPFYVLNADDYSIAMANTAAEDMGISKAKTCYSMTHRLDEPCSGNEHPCPLQHVKTYKEPFVVEHKHYREDGSFYDVEVHGYPIYDDDGNVVQMIEYLLDISARKHAELQAERLLQEQVAVRKALEAITSSLDIETVLQQIAEEMGSAIDASSAYILLWDDEARTSTVVSEYFSPDALDVERTSDMGAVHFETDEDFIESLHANKYTVDRLADLDEASSDYEHMQQYGAKTALYIPIQFNNQPIAFAEIWESRLQRDFTPEEIILCQHMAQNAAVAINNARNYRQAQLEIQRREDVERELRKLSNAAEQAASGIVITDQNSVVEYANPAASRITGYTSEEFIGQTTNILKSGMHDDEFYEDLWQTIKRGDTWRGELINRRKDGSLYWESQVISPVTNRQGRVTHYVAIKEDITLAKETRERLATLSNAVEQSASAVVITDPDGYVEFVNPAFTKISGYTADEVTGKKIGHVLSSNKHEPEFYANLVDTVGRGDIWKGEMLNRRKDGSLYWESTVISPVFDDDGKLVHIVEIKEDVSARKELEQSLALAHEEALVASDMKTQLLANVSHDMRTPLGAILGYTEMLQGGVFEPLNDEQENAMRAISSSAQRLLDFVNNLLSQAQIDTGKIVLNRAPFDPEKLLTTMGGELSFARSKGLTVETKVADDLPDMLEGDAYWLGQILHNLVSNAIKFTPEGGTINIEFSRADEAHWCFSVADTGKGIPADAQEYIFDTFRQVDGSAHRETHTGSGLGLSIVQHLVRLMDGEIALESEVDQGSIFTVTLPLQQAEEN